MKKRNSRSQSRDTQRDNKDFWKNKTLTLGVKEEEILLLEAGQQFSSKSSSCADSLREKSNNDSTDKTGQRDTFRKRNRGKRRLREEQPLIDKEIWNKFVWLRGSKGKDNLVFSLYSFFLFILQETSTPSTAFGSS